VQTHGFLEATHEQKTAVDVPRPKCDAKAIEALLEKAQKLPPSKRQTEALTKADLLRNAAETYKHIFSKELKPPS
jgi:hypothetical protein